MQHSFKSYESSDSVSRYQFKKKTNRRPRSTKSITPRWSFVK